MKIVTEFVYPPVPIRSFDWSAHDADTYEPGKPLGFGATEREAIDDLTEQLGLAICEECGELRDCSTEYGDMRDPETGHLDSVTLCTECWEKLEGIA